MRLITEGISDQKSILIVDPGNTKLGSDIEDALNQYDTPVKRERHFPDNREFDLVFYVNETHITPETTERAKKSVYIFIDDIDISHRTLATLIKTKSRYKVIHITDAKTPNIIEQILWFSLTSSRESFVSLGPSLPKKPEKSTTKKRSKIQFKIPKIKKRFLMFFILIMLLFHISIVPTLALSSYYFYRSANELKNENLDSSRSYFSKARFIHTITKSIYPITRPTYLFLSLAIIPDNLVDINDKTQNILEHSTQVFANGNHILKGILTKNKNKAEIDLLESRIKKTQEDLKVIESDLQVIEQKLPTNGSPFEKVKSQIEENIELIRQGQQILPYLPEILGKKEEKKYLLLFANNMELRPGGGFIGSFGILTMKDLTFVGLEVFDVYDADGQLTIHVEPPEPIRKYLEQPNWFLRDVAFSPDFTQNYNQAKFFLEQELELTDFAGGAIVTTTAIQNILTAFENVYLPDFQETVNKDNFYIKAQLHSEDNFFPGSIQKKSFLSSLTRQLIINLDRASPGALSKAAKKALDEKQLALTFENQSVQAVIDRFYWSGRVIDPRCPQNQPSCVSDYLLTTDANLGVNKVNFFVTRQIEKIIKIAPNGSIDTTFRLKLKNNSPSEAFPGGFYKNYLQMTIPSNATLSRLTRNGVVVEEYDENVEIAKTIGFLVQMPPKSEAVIEAQYRLGSFLGHGKQLYQFVLQKQIGSRNSDFSLEIITPENIKLLNQNFSPLVKDNHIFYNTSLSADKIFLLEFQRK